MVWEEDLEDPDVLGLSFLFYTTEDWGREDVC